MIELIIAFLISIGWYTPTQKSTISVNETSANKYGIVVVDDGYPRYGTVVYNELLGIYQLEE